MSDSRVTINFGGGLSIMGIAAAILSWTANHSIAWSILHFFCGPLYVLYYAITHI